MKLFSKVLLCLLLIVAALLAGAYLLPSHLEIEQTVVLEAPPEAVYFYLENPSEWEKWSMLNKQEDPSMIHLYGGPTTGKGARLQWSGDRVGEGKLVFTESISPATLSYQQTEKGMATPLRGKFSLSPVQGGGTRVVWKQEAALGETPLARLMGLVQKYRKQNEVEKGLLGLKTLFSNSSKHKSGTKTTAYATYH